jgi:hypothetical protein
MERVMTTKQIIQMHEAIKELENDDTSPEALAFQDMTDYLPQLFESLRDKTYEGEWKY